MSRVIAITHLPSSAMNGALRTFIDVEAIDLALAAEQHATYRQTLARAGADIVVLDVNAAHADAVFVEDTAVVLDEVVVMTSMGAAARRDEVAGIEAELRARRLADRIERIEPPATLEGGDVLRVGRTLFVGATARTNDAGIEALARIAGPHGYAVHRVPVQGCLHLKTGCTALPDGTFLVNPRWVSPSALPSGASILAVAEDEPSAANVVLVGDRIVMSAAYPRTIDLIRARGFLVDAVALTELEKAEGSATCLSLLVPSPRVA